MNPKGQWLSKEEYGLLVAKRMKRGEDYDEACKKVDDIDEELKKKEKKEKKKSKAEQMKDFLRGLGK